LGKLAQPRTYLGKDEEGWFAISAHELALRFNLSNPTLTVALSGMHTIADVETNIQMVEKINQGGDPMPERWQRFIREKWEEANRNCTLCGKCLPCPQEVNIPENMRYRNWQHTWGLEAEAREAYKLLGEPHWTPWGGSITGKSAGACNRCGECEPRCPIHIPIIQFLGENTAALSAQEANNEA